MHVSAACPGCWRRWLSLLQLALGAAKEEKDGLNEGWSDASSPLWASDGAAGPSVLL